MSGDRVWPPLARAEVIKAIERRGPARIPVVMAKWWSNENAPEYNARLSCFDRFNEDAGFLWIEPLEFERMGLSWEFATQGSHDARVVLDDWAKLDEFIEKLPDPERDPRFEALAAQAETYRGRDLYTLFAFWQLFFERPWTIRGMQNLLTDYYEYPEQIHRLNDALCSLYLGYLRRAIRELRTDGFWTSDDLGHQTGLFMRPATFRAFLKPYYARIGALLKEHQIHWWLHSCGNNTPVLGDLAEVGLNVFHPVQKNTMDEAAVARDFGERLTFLSGFDMQRILSDGTPEQVRAEVRHLIDTFDRPDGGMLIAAGNGIVDVTPLDNIEAFLDEAYTYGEAHRRAFAGD